MFLEGCLAFHVTPQPLSTPVPTLSLAPTVRPTPSVTPSPSPTATSTPIPSPTPRPLQVEFFLPETEIAQGHTLFLRVQMNKAGRISGHLREREIHFVPKGQGEFVAFVGVSALAELGSRPLTVTVQTNAGEEAAFHAILRIVSGEYSQERLVLSPEMSRLLAPEIARPERERLQRIYSTLTPRVLWAGPFAWPFKGPVTSAFGTRREYGNVLRSYHAGVDIDGEEGDIIRAPADGRVLLAEFLQVRGGAVILDHGAGVVTGYYHLSDIAVQPGQFVHQGDALGKMGSTGLATGSHLHWELRVGGIAVDPLEWTERSWP
ncbi:MAG: peptidoglycan DD-metalloendopeptidase family protein [Anaerolineae bacterium]|nr:peptidoglycan DD-metalloendopeptidase family protein [Anaerolineae bacterium]